MVITNDVELPTFEELEEKEVNLSSATLMSAAPYLGKYCENINNEFMLCRYENGDDPRPCVEFGKLVTRCTMEFFQKVKKDCLHEHEQYANCVDKSSGNYLAWPCRKTHAIYQTCMKDKLNLKYPGFGYFTRGRVHKSGCTQEPPEPPCPCLPRPGGDDEATHQLPDCKKKYAARFGSRNYWMTE